MTSASHLADARIAITELGPVASTLGSLGGIRFMCNWLGWPDWLRANTSLTGTGPIPQYVTWADDLIITANILDNVDMAQLINRKLDSPGSLLDSSHTMIFQSAPTLLEAIQVYVQSVNTLNPHLIAHIDHHCDSLIYTIKPTVSLGRLMDFFGFLSCVTVFGAISGLRYYQLDQATIRLTGSRDSYGHAANRMGRKVEFDCEIAGLTFPSAWGELAGPDKEPATWSLALQQVEARRQGQKEIALASRIGGQVRNALEREGRIIKIEQVVEQEGISARTIARVLERAETSFQQIVQNERRWLALGLIRDPNLSIQQISGRLGFSEVSSFSRAFKQWFGQSPRAFRRAQ